MCYCLELCLVGSHHFYEIICIMDTLKTVARDGWFDNKMAMEATNKCSAITICSTCSCLILVDTVCHILQLQTIELIHRTLTIYKYSVINELRIGVCKVPLNFLEEEHVLFHAAMWCHLHRIFSTLYYLSHYVDLLLTTQCCKKKGYTSDTKQVCGIQVDIINNELN